MASSPHSRTGFLPNWFWPCVPAGLAIALFSTCVWRESLWEWLTIYHLRPYFADLMAVLAASDAHAAGADPYHIPLLFDPYGRPHTYGPWWLYLHHLGITRQHADVLGWALMLTAVSTFAWVLRPKNIQQALMAGLMLSSPPLLLAYERGNNDLLIVLLFILAGSMDSRARRIHIPTIAIGIATMLKIYPLAAALMLVRYSSPRRTLMAGIALTAGVLIGVYVWRTDFARIWSIVPRPETMYAYGFRITVRLWEKQPSLSPAIGLIAGMLTSLVALGWAGGFRRRLLEQMTTGREGSYFLAGSAMWIFCYFTNVNYPYRIALLVLVATAWFRIWQQSPPKESTSARRLLTLLTLTIWAQVLRLLLVLAIEQDYLAAGTFSFGLEHGSILGLTLIMALAIGCRLRLAWSEYHTWRADQPQSASPTHQA